MSLVTGNRVLIVEDEALVAFALEDMLIDLRCTVVGPAVRLQEAFSLIACEQLDAAILDVNIGGARSYPVADELERRGVPYIFATGYGNEGVEPRRTAIRVLTKPYRRQDVEAALLCLLGKQRPGSDPVERA